MRPMKKRHIEVRYRMGISRKVNKCNNESKWEVREKGRERVTQEGLQNYGNEPEWT